MSAHYVNPDLFRVRVRPRPGVLSTPMSRLRIYQWRCSNCGASGTHYARDGENHHTITAAITRGHAACGRGCVWDEDAVYIRQTQITH